MVKRDYWLEMIEKRWQQRSIIWLSGVRRVGKTCLCQSLDDIAYFDCELPRVRRQMETDPESFLSAVAGKKVVLDEIHRLQRPAEILKIAADHFPSVKIIATGSSTLGASQKFRDTLTDRKEELWLTPMTTADMSAFGNIDLDFRFVRGGLPPFFMADEFPERSFQGWMDSYWAKDIQEMFRLERRYSFQRFAELLFSQSSGIFEASSFSTPCEVSRTTIRNYLAVLEATFVVHVVRPFSTHRPTEIVSAPKVYGFDTGFVCYHKGWDKLRPDDMGALWEHFVLNEMHAYLQTRVILYWRNKQRREVDFVIRKRGRPPVTIECKWAADNFEPGSLMAFRRQYPGGENYVVVQDVVQPFNRKYGNITVTFTGLDGLISGLRGD